MVESAMRTTTRRDRGLSLLEVIIALSILAIVMLMVATMSGRSQSNVMEATLMARAEAAARFTMEQLVTADFNNYLCAPSPNAPAVIGPYTRFQQADPTKLPKVSDQFSVNAPGLPMVNNYGQITVREPTALECPWYRYATNPGTTPPIMYRGYRSWSYTAAGGTHMLDQTGVTPNVTCLIIIVEVKIPATVATSPCNIRLQSLRFYL